jgi:CRISPR-associated protein Cmr6
LWLFCHLGGAGSKARKGFGSFADLPGLSLEDCRLAGEALRRECGLTARFEDRQARSASVEKIIGPPTGGRPWLEVPTPWRDPWFALDQVGFAAQCFAQGLAHQEAKGALGLPRQIHGPRNEPMHHQQRDRHRPPQRLRGPRGDRHASPVFYHLARNDDGTLTVRVTAFLAPELRNPVESESVLRDLLTHMQADLGARASRPGNQGPRPPGPGARSGAGPTPTPAAPAASGRRPAGTPASVKVLALHDKGPKDSFFVQEEGRPRGLLSHGKPPGQLPQVGSTIEVYIHSDDLRSPQYRWDKPAVQSQGLRRGPGGRGPNPRGRR